MDITQAIRAMDITESNSNSTTKIIRKKRASQGNASEVVGKSDASSWILLRNNVVLMNKRLTGLPLRAITEMDITDTNC